MPIDLEGNPISQHDADVLRVIFEKCKAMIIPGVDVSKIVVTGIGSEISRKDIDDFQKMFFNPE